MNPPSPPAPFDLATASGGGPGPTTALDLDTMARIAEAAGREAFRERAAQPPLDAIPALRAIPTADGRLVTATRLYRACLRGATDPATD